MPSFRVRSFVQEGRRLVFANTIFLKIFDVFCLTVTWLITKLQENEFHLGKRKLFRADRSTTIYKTKQGGILMGLADNISFEKLTLNINAKFKTVKVSGDAISVILCCVYNPTDKSPHRPPYEAIKRFSDQLIQHQINRKCLSTIIVGDIDFKKRP